MTAETSPGLVIVLWIANVVIDSVGQLAFKAAATESADKDGLAHWIEMSRRPWLWLGIGCYVMEFVVWLAFLSLVPLSQGVLLGSINIVAIMLAGRFFFAEKLTPLRVLGISLISIGVAVVGIQA
ncbi:MULTISPECIES: EamA family transporter [Pseudomonas]|uniref:EamA family transporter n=1 Tax=Pseudomonas TaxID=286 RepID=UPI0025969ED2|nr:MULTISPECIES: EamA family transporter [Pseudomonas]